MPKRTRISRSTTRVKRRRRSLVSKRRSMTRYRRPVAVCSYKKLRYCDNFTLNAGVAAAATHSFRANSVFDPDWTGVGHQPLGFDEMAALYQHYTVVGAKVKATFIPVDTSGTTGASHVGLVLDDDASIPSDFNTIKEQQRSSVRICSALPSKPVTITKNFSARKFFCNNNPSLSDKYSAAVTTNPSESAFFTLWQSGISDAADPAAIYVDIEIDYLVRFTEPKTLTGS